MRNSRIDSSWVLQMLLICPIDLDPRVNFQISKPSRVLLAQYLQYVLAVEVVEGLGPSHSLYELVWQMSKRRWRNCKSLICLRVFDIDLGSTRRHVFRVEAARGRAVLDEVSPC